VESEEEIFVFTSFNHRNSKLSYECTWFNFCENFLSQVDQEIKIQFSVSTGDLGVFKRASGNEK
jgi:hypothetical protein